MPKNISIVPERIFVFGLDGATWRIIDGFVKKNHLPFFKKMISQGLKMNLISPIPPRTAPSWASFVTGLNPGGHGISDFLVKENIFGKRREKLANGNLIKNHFFWDYWQGYDKKIALINLPMTHPIRKIKNGVIISSLLTSSSKNWFYPKSLSRILERVEYKAGDFNFLEKIYLSKSSSRDKLDRIEGMIKSKFLLAKFLIERDDWDFFFLLFNEVDWIQHLFWRGNQTLAVYKKIDSYLTEIYQILSKKYGARGFYFFIMSDHGFHPAPKIYFNIYPWLRKNGFIKPTPGVFLARALRKISFWIKDKNKVSFRSWGKTSLLEIDNFGIWLNKKALTGKYYSFRNRLIEELKKVKFSNGKKVFKLVAKRENIYWGSRLKRFCDIVWLTNPYFAVGPCSIEGKLFVPRTPGIKAIHDSDRNGILLVKGLKIRKRFKKWQGKRFYIWNLREIFNQIFSIKSQKEGQGLGCKKNGRRKFENEDLVKARLKSLGYI